MSVTKANQSIDATTMTVVTWNGSATGYTNSEFDFATEEWTPGIAGKYHLSCQLMLASLGASKAVDIFIMKNDSVTLLQREHVASTGGDGWVTIDHDFYLDSDDKIEIQIYHDDVSARTLTGGYCHWCTFYVGP
jgi:hypothetical protein